ncbi:MAG TPA: amino acid adenylation domain-containing protein, partial [Longimicrobium sp.]|nr:amino acid adenylation domain-containing protein [Longimicrobium sp.]
PLRALFEGPTVAELAERVDALRRADGPALPPIVPVARDRDLPLSSAQERLWFLDRLEGGSSFYNIPMAIRLLGGLDTAALEQAIGEIVRRHETLRTTIHEVGEAAVQVIAPFAGFALAVDDLSALADDARAAETDRRARESAARPFDLAAGPLFRANLLRLASEEHVLLICMHHVVSDGTSLGVLLRELSALYAAYREGGESTLAELAVQYADFAVWQREQLQGEVLDRQLAWWKGRLGGAPTLLELPTDRPRPAVQSYRGAREPLSFPAGLLDRLQSLGRGEGATLYMVLLGAFQVLLAKYAGTEDVVVGSPIAGRTRRETEELIGFFANTLVLRTELDGDPSFREVLRRVRDVTLGAFEHQEVPFEKLVAELQPERSLSHAPIFQVMFTLQNADATGIDLPALRLEGVPAALETTRFDLGLSVITDGMDITGSMEYSTDLFDAETIRRMLGHLERVLEQVVEDADRRMSALALLGEAEQARVVDEWNRTAADYPADACIHTLIAEQTARTPDAVAVVFADDALTYAELDARANRLARRIVSLGAGPEAFVGICLDRSAEMVVAMLAVLKSGAAYLPLDPSYPADRLAYMLEDSGAPLLITQQALRNLLPADGVRVLSIDAEADASAIAAESADAPATSVVAENAAYVIYTSGSTGRPKGVQVTHGNAVSFFTGMDGRVGGTARGTWLAVTRISFDIHVLELLWTLARGFRVVVQPEPDRARDGETIAEQIRRHGVTHLQCTPSLAAMLIAESGIEALAGLDRILLGGEALPADLAAQIRTVLPDGVVNMYGPTETTVWSATHAVDRDGAVPIGRPIANTRVYVVDAAMHAQPAGVPGELLIGGAGVTRGYLARPELTADRFVPDAFSATPGARLYRTGDRARWRADGVLEYLGRIDQQVKIRGFRIEPGEIESVLRRHPAVAECAVVARASAAGDTRLVAYVVGAADAEALRAHVGASLPDYMVPAAFVSLDALPLTPNGKLDRKALPAPDFAAAADAYEAPRTETEATLAGIWADVLRVERIGVRDDFFALGGHSLLATRMVSRVREAFGVELPLRAVFEAPVLARLAERVEAAREADASRTAPAPARRLGPVDRGAYRLEADRLAAAPALGSPGAPPLSFAQERMWVLNRLDPGSAVYNLPLAFRLRGAMDVRALERALGEILRRHAALRTTFAETADDAAVQVIAPFAGFHLPVDDLSGLGEAEREAEVRRRATEDALRPFDLGAGPLFRAALLRLGAEEHVLLACIHHIVADGWSLGLFFGELSALYGAYRDGAESPLPPLPLQYADFAAWQRAHLAGAELDRQLGYWRGRLDGAPGLLELPTDRPRPAVQSYHGARETVEFPPALLDRLQALGRGEGATLYMVLLGAFSVLLGRYAGVEDVVVGSPIAGRTRSETESLIGLFANTLVLRTELEGDPSFREVLGRVRDVALGAYEHQDLPFEKLVAELQPERSLSHAPVFQVMFTLQDADSLGVTLPGLEGETVAPGERTAMFDLALALTTAGGTLHGGITYAADLFDRATIQRMAAHLQRLLEQVADDAGTRISALELLDAPERALVVDEWNRTERALPAERRVHRSIAEQAARTPGAVAVLFGGESLTYGELDARANRLARHLVSLGAGPEARVGICLERGAEMVVAMLAVLKTGAAYLPLDPSYPADRLAYMLEDSGAPLLVTQDALRDLLPAESVRVVSVDAEADAAAIEAESADALEDGADAENAAYVIYTSGSTGRPKGVQVTHANATSFFAAMDERVGGTVPGTWLAVTRISFDIHVLELLWTLARGFRVVVQAEPDRAAPGESLAEQIRRHAVTHLQCTPSLAAMLIAESGTDALAGLDRILLGGEALPADLAAQIRAVLPDGVINLYGPTETT